MQPLTAEGQREIGALANKYQVSVDAVNTLLQALVYGNGTMAQFNHPELGGSGQWMQGGMTMVGDMFNTYLSSLVNNLCIELTQVLANRPFVEAPNVQAQSSGFSIQWPERLGMPTFSSGQNNYRYAYFANKNRLAIEQNGQMTVYDTLDHHITGASQQQQGNVATIVLTSQYGVVNIQDLPVVSGVKPEQKSPTQNTQPTTAKQEEQDLPVISDTKPEEMPSAENLQPTTTEEDVFAKIERLANLKEKGILSETEFSDKKTELLSRL